DRVGAGLYQEQSEPVAVIGGGAGAQTAWRQRFEQAAGDRCVAALAGGYFKRDGTTATIDNSMDFCRSPAARAADRLEIGPLFRRPPSDVPWRWCCRSSGCRRDRPSPARQTVAAKSRVAPNDESDCRSSSAGH